MIQWTPISEMPDELRDGRRLLLWGEFEGNGYFVVAQWFPEGDYWESDDDYQYQNRCFTHYCEITQPEDAPAILAELRERRAAEATAVKTWLEYFESLNRNVMSTDGGKTWSGLLFSVDEMRKCFLAGRQSRQAEVDGLHQKLASAETVRDHFNEVSSQRLVLIDDLKLELAAVTKERDEACAAMTKQCEAAEAKLAKALESMRRIAAEAIKEIAK